jgi:2-hydroxy-5-methyl-1-naphthoate 7-hydroxylase
LPKTSSGLKGRYDVIPDGTVFPLPAAEEMLPDTHARLRAAGPVVRIELPGGVRVWATTTHAAAREVLSGHNTRFAKHSSHWSALHDGTIPDDWALRPLVLGEHMLQQDGDNHRRLRGLVSRDFTPSRVAALRPRVVEIVDELLDDVVAGEHPVDLVPAFTMRLPMAVICELLGIPADERPQLRSWTETLFSYKRTADQTHVAARGLREYLGDLIELKRRAPGTDLTSAMVRGHDDEQLTRQELVDCLFLLIVAGHDTTMHLLGHAIVALLSQPEQLALAITGDRWDNVVEETLRLKPPVYSTLFHYAMVPTTVAGVRIAAGEAVMLCLGGAATDPTHHGPDATHFDITRQQRGHLAFGHGAHFCLGAPLARMEGQVALAALFHRLPDLKAAIPLADIPYSPSFLTYGPRSLSVFPG